MISEFANKAGDKMQKSLDTLSANMSKLRTGRAQPNLLDQVMVDYYGSATPLKQLANIVVEDARTLAVQPYDQGSLQTIEKAIQDSNLDLNPAIMGNLIRVPLPTLTEERRLEYTKIAKNEAENGRIAIRNIRRDLNTEIKNAQKDKLVSEDDAKRAEDKIQQLTNDYIAKVDSVLEAKEKDLLTV
jgi:ribosome recycling factor